MWKPRSLIFNDLYKFTMQNVALKLFPNERVKYRLFIRKPREFPENFAEKLREAVDRHSILSLTAKEYTYVRENCPYFDHVYLDYLKNYRYDPSEVTVGQPKKNEIYLDIDGLWHRTLPWEVTLMHTISELYFEGYPLPKREILKDINVSKAKRYLENRISLYDMGTRRGHSFENHCNVLEDFLSVPDMRESLKGTSNVYLAMTLGLKPIGTKAHEFYSMMAAIYGFIHANTAAMEKWYEVYKGALAIELPDTFTTNAFLHAFDYKWAKLSDGVRQDSGNPFDFAIKLIQHYNILGINHKTKSLFFSDSLNDKKVVDINNWLLSTYGRKGDFGVGTTISNDIPGIEPLNMVIKLVGRYYGSLLVPTVKISDDVGKNTGDPGMVKLCHETFANYAQQFPPSKENFLR